MKPLTKKDPGYADRNKGPSAKSGDSRAECERAGAGKSAEVDTEIDEANALRIKVVFLCDARVVVFLCACLLESSMRAASTHAVSGQRRRARTAWAQASPGCRRLEKQAVVPFGLPGAPRAGYFSFVGWFV